MLVSDLIDHAEHKWKPCIINMLFNDRDVQNITIMPIIDEVNDDKHIWSFTPQADYSVCSAYQWKHSLIIVTCVWRETRQNFGVLKYQKR
jgi:hypothetical protein